MYVLLKNRNIFETNVLIYKKKHKLPEKMK